MSCSRSWAATCRPPPDYASPPPLWGSEEHVRGLFADSGVELEFARGLNPWRFDSAEHWVVFMETHYGPTLKARERLDRRGPLGRVPRRDPRDGRAPQRGDRRQPPHPGEYLVTIGRKAG